MKKSKKTSLSFVDAANDFNRTIKNDEFSYLNSWKQCHDAFSRPENQKMDDEELALRLSFFLASWGMYRGSGFIFRKDYRIHLDIVSILMKPKYKELRDIPLSEINKKAIGLMVTLFNELSKSYKKNTEIVNGVRHKGGMEPSILLITKIMLGALGCVPAYDKYVKKALAIKRIVSSRFDHGSLSALVRFAKENRGEINKAKDILQNGSKGVPYPDMKVLDMGLWFFGKEFLDRNKV
jgi:hypothetical protein